MDPGGHVSDDVIEQYSMGTLPVFEVEPFEKHLLVCEACQDRLRDMDDFLAALRAAARKIARHVPGEEE
jgi:hypothetical protein